jgi:anti-sigma B factor antagonist
MISTEWINDIAVARVTEDRVDASRAPAFKDEIAQLIEGGANRLVLDLGAVRFIDSSGLGAIVSCLKRLGPTGALAIAGAEGAVARLFALTRMDRVIAMRATVDAAVAELSG